MHMTESAREASHPLAQRAAPSAEGDASNEAPSLSGALSEMGLVDLVQTLELGRKSGVMRVEAAGLSGALWMREGAIVDAELGRHRGEDAVHRLLGLSEGRFEVDFAPQDREDRIGAPTHSLLAEGVQRIAERRRLCEGLPPLSTVLVPEFARIADKLADIPDEMNPVLRLVSGDRTISQVVHECELDELAALEALIKLLQGGLLVELREPAPAPAESPAASAPARPAPALLDSGATEGGAAWFQSP